MANKKLKEVKHICIICGEKINKPKDKYVRLTDFDGKIETSECFYHLKCWKEKFEIQKRRALGSIKPIIDEFTNNFKGEYIIC